MQSFLQVHTTHYLLSRGPLPFLSGPLGSQRVPGAASVAKLPAGMVLAVQILQALARDMRVDLRGREVTMA